MWATGDTLLNLHYHVVEGKNSEINKPSSTPLLEDNSQLEPIDPLLPPQDLSRVAGAASTGGAAGVAPAS